MVEKTPKNFRHNINKFKIFFEFFFPLKCHGLATDAAWNKLCAMRVHTESSAKYTKLADNKNKIENFFNSHRKLKTLFCYLRFISVAWLGLAWLELKSDIGFLFFSVNVFWMRFFFSCRFPFTACCVWVKIHSEKRTNRIWNINSKLKVDRSA